MIGRDLYYARITPTGERSTHVARVWDGALFITSQQKQAVAQAERDGVPADAIAPSSEAEYNQQRAARR